MQCKELLFFIACNLLSISLAKPYIPEHCGNFEGALLQACLHSALTDTKGSYTNTKVLYPVFEDSSVQYYDVTPERHATPGDEHVQFNELDELHFSAKPSLAEV
nr:MAG: hypothetical protein [Erinaceus hedgehog coronavirus HKU31]